MKKFLGSLAAVAFIGSAIMLMSAGQTDGVMTKSGSTTIVNTTSLTKKVRGYAGATPVKIFIEKGKVTKVEALKNRETPKYMAAAKKVLDAFSGKSVSKASKLEVDAVTGATFTSKALVKNVHAGLKYYKENK